MDQCSEEESSDSSSDFLVSCDKIDFNSSFFSKSAPKHNLTTKQSLTVDSSEESDNDDFNCDDDANADQPFACIIKNLENAKNTTLQNVERDEFDSSAEVSDSKEKKDLKSTKVPNSGLLASEINDLLLQGESGAIASTSHQSDDEENVDATETSSGYSIPKEGLTITLDSNIISKRKTGQDLETRLKNRMNQELRANQIVIHKVGLLCWLSYGFYLNKEVNNPEILSTMLSLISSNNYPKGRADLSYLESITKWFRRLFTLEYKDDVVNVRKEILLDRLKKRKIHDYKELVLLYAAMLRAIGINCRLVVSLCPPVLKVPRDQLFQINVSKQGEKSNAKITKNKEKQSIKNSKAVKNSKSKLSETKNSPQKSLPENSPLAKRNANLEAKKKAAAVLHAKFANTKSNIKLSLSEDHSKENVTREKCTRTEQKNTKKIIAEDNLSISKRSLRSNSKAEIAKSETKHNNDDTIPKSTETLGSKLKRLKTQISKPSTSNQFDDDSESEFALKQPTKRKLNNFNKKSVSGSKTEGTKSRKLLSSDDEGEELGRVKKRQDIWVEVYLESEDNWISVNVPDEKIHCITDIYKKATSPVLYVIAWNSLGTLKDVTRRYCPQWLTVTRKQRVDEKWWSETLAFWKEKETAISKNEDEMLLQRELEQPLPKTVGECKNHPLYALTRHLLKYEALYPENAVPLGHLRTGEAVYSRHCVHTLRSRETWVRNARVVKPKEEPYKIVKSLPKYDKLSGVVIKDQALELFGKWQTMPYVPPEAKDGVVPRNEFGNVDLFKQCMIPKGTVHLKLPGLNRIARKLNIDCAPAVVGFNFGGMGAVPAFEGFIVCSEFADILSEAWQTEQIEATKRAKEKRDKRIYGNWRKLIKGLLIRERLAAKYNFCEEEKPTVSNKRSKQKKGVGKKVKM